MVVRNYVIRCTAAAETIKAMYSSGVEAMKKAKLLFYAAIGAAAIKILWSVKPIGLHAFEDFSLNDLGLGVGILGVGLAALRMGVAYLDDARRRNDRAESWVVAVCRFDHGENGGNTLPSNIVSGTHQQVYDGVRWLLWPGVATMGIGLPAGTAIQSNRTHASLKRPKAEGVVDEDDAPDRSRSSGGQWHAHGLH
jgi:hypothetical protein